MIFFVYGINYYMILDSPYFLKTNTTWAILLIINIFFFKKGLSLSKSTNLTAAIVYIGIMNASLCLGREKTMGIYFINIIPLALGLFLSRRYLLFWSSLCILAYPFLKYIGPIYFSHLDIPLSQEFNDFLWESSYYVNMGLIITFILIYMFALKKSLRSLEEKSDTAHGLLRILTHDIRNPLTIIYSSAQLLQRKDMTPEEVQKWAEKISFGSKMITNITDQVKQIEAIESGKSRVELQSVSLNHVINNLSQIFQGKLEDKKLSLIQHGDFNISVQAEPNSLTHQVLSNILSNAIKFSQAESEIQLRVQNAEDYAKVSIRDSGIGIPKKILDNLFSKTVPTTRQGTNGEHGTGFGMPLVKEYMELYQGEVSVVSKDISESPDDHGTEITLTFKKCS